MRPIYRNNRQNVEMCGAGMSEIRRKMQLALGAVLCIALIAAANAIDGRVERRMTCSATEMAWMAPTLPPDSPAVPGSTHTSQGKLDLNTADAWMLTAIPGVGKTIAQRVIAYREKYGAFVDVRELERIDGIGPVLCEVMAQYVEVK